MDDDTINSIGIWALRIVLCAGAIYCAVNDKNEAASTIATLVVVSFLFL